MSSQKTGHEDDEPVELNAVLSLLYAHEINCGFQSFWDGGWEVWLGDELNGYRAQASVETPDDAARWLLEAASILYPASGIMANVTRVWKPEHALKTPPRGRPSPVGAR